MTVKYDEVSGLYVAEDGAILKPIKQWKDHHGYMQVTVDRKNMQVHRIVARAFCEGQSETNNIVMHIDDDPTNNNASNLKWGTSSENNYDAYKHGLKTTNYCVRCMETGEVFHSAREAAKQMWGNPKRADKILMACRNERGKAYGYHWEMVNR